MVPMFQFGKWSTFCTLRSFSIRYFLLGKRRNRPESSTVLILSPPSLSIYLTGVRHTSRSHQNPAISWNSAKFRYVQRVYAQPDDEAFFRQQCCSEQFHSLFFLLQVSLTLLTLFTRNYVDIPITQKNKEKINGRVVAFISLNDQHRF